MKTHDYHWMALLQDFTFRALSSFFFSNLQKETYYSFSVPIVHTSTNSKSPSINFSLSIYCCPSFSILSCSQSFSTTKSNYSLSIVGLRIRASYLCIFL